MQFVVVIFMLNTLLPNIAKTTAPTGGCMKRQLSQGFGICKSMFDAADFADLAPQKFWYTKRPFVTCQDV